MPITSKSDSSASAGFCPQRIAQLQQRLQAEVAQARLPGAVALVVQRGQTVLDTAVGCLDPALRTPMRSDAIFRIYSMTKPLVSVAVMMLVEQGRLLLSDPVSRFLPEFSALQVVAHVQGHAMLQPSPAVPSVQDLLRHTAGLTYEFLGSSPLQLQYSEARLGARNRTNREFSRTLAQLPLMFEPGTVWEYSRATDLLGAVVEVVSGQSLGDYLRQHIFEPLGMVDTGFTVPARHHDRIAEPFAHDPDGGEPMPLIDLREQVPLEGGGGGLASTAQDYARFLQCLLNEGVLDGARLLAPSTVRYMTADHLGSIPVNGTGRSSELLPPGHGFGLGFAVRTAVGLAPTVGSVGMYFWSGIAGTTFFVDPAREFYAIFMAQAPLQRDYYRQLFRSLVYAALLE